jgi:hypothetical protein
MYRYIEEDFLAGQAAQYNLKNGKYVHTAEDGDIDPKQYEGNFRNWLKDNDNVVINGWRGWPELAIVRGGQLYGLEDASTAALGSLGLPGGPALVNELGTEAIVTPYGTVTSLPSGTGVIPADITRSLWELGNAAPSMLSALGADYGRSREAEGDTLNFGVINMNVNADGTFDVNRFVTELKTASALRKNS